MTADQAADCHAGGWSDAEIAAFTTRRDRLRLWGYSEKEADDLAERLTLRDREHDGRRLCFECEHLKRGLCGNWQEAGYSRAETVPLRVLWNCPGFSIARDLAQDPPESDESTTADPGVPPSSARAPGAI